ncbi:MAG: 50S ribosomal protein L3 [Chlamydiales bacterium]|nr:50S ribosomal protein L3 [Chlamydiales bacterium]
MSNQLLGKKEGMTKIFDDKGNLVVCTVISIEKHVVLQVKTVNGKDGYNAVQLGAVQKKAKHTTKPLQGHFKKAGVEPRRHLFEVSFEGEAPFQVGQEIGLELFEGVPYIDVTGQSQGKGFQGVMRRYDFKGGPAAHGSKFHRSGGSTGCRSTPGRCLPGTKKPGHMGAERVTVQSLKVVRLDAEKGVVVVKGAIPGSKGSSITISKAVKKQK